MWKKIKIDGVEYLVKYSKTENQRTIQITNLMHLWFEDITELELLERCKKSNIFLEASDEVLLGHIFSLLTSEETDVTRTFVDENSNKTLNLQTTSDGFRFKMHFSLQLASHIQFYEEVTFPFLVTISELEKRQNSLVNMIKRKDLEILEYKLEGGQISRKAVETVPFDLETFSLECAEGISTTKSQILDHPSHALSPLVQDVLDKIADAPLITITQPASEEQPNHNKKIKLKTKLPLKNRKPNMYEDESDESETEGRCKSVAGSSKLLRKS